MFGKGEYLRIEMGRRACDNIARSCSIRCEFHLLRSVAPSYVGVMFFRDVVHGVYESCLRKGRIGYELVVDQASHEVRIRIDVVAGAKGQ